MLNQSMEQLACPRLETLKNDMSDAELHFLVFTMIMVSQEGFLSNEFFPECQ